MPSKPPLKRAPLKRIERSVFTKLSHLILGAWDRLRRAWFRWAELNQHNAWFPVLVGAVVGLDAMIIILPGDVLVALATLSNPNAWRRLALWAGLGSALGAFCLYLLLQVFGRAPVVEINKQLENIGAGSIPQATELTGENMAAAAAEAEDEDEPKVKTSSPVRPARRPSAAVAERPTPAPTPTAPDPALQSPRWAAARQFFDKHGLFSLALGSLLPFLSWPPVVLAGLSSDKWAQVLFYLLLGRILRFMILCFGLREGWAMFTTLKHEAKAQKERREQQKRGGG